ncbi:hypothetical protein [Sorangium sp. So ce145]|uniref:hypothetical protein n=1 Tax=Sorangium sp. So ce145 TaxID=3133285 RepID=UPI003F619240
MAPRTARFGWDFSKMSIVPPVPAPGERTTGSDTRSLHDGSGQPASRTDLGGMPGALGEKDGDDQDIGGGFGSLVGPPQFTVSASTTTGPTFGSCRAFDWIEDWSTTGRNGFIVQEITNTGSITRCDGTSMTPPNTPHYWEAWPVDAAGVVGDGGADLWHRATRPGTRGRWSMTGNVGFVGALDPAAGFSRTGVPDANGLLSTRTDPTNLYISTLTRRKSGEWNCCDGNNFHRGT